MTARRAKTGGKRQTGTMPWSPEFRAFFRLAADDLTPPATVRVARNRRSYTFQARFKDIQGRTIVFTTRAVLTPAGAFQIASENMRINFSIVSPGRAA
ncbi:MAG: hypothetical protein ACK41C_10340 [Phenylobacterium sp.]|uniref:hypothetical protein n=1 Tax=Phenylobacterium sp. TaxID=1871053 RepID=UPI00391DA41E